MTDDETPKILIVDDEPRNLDALEAMLEPTGCTLVRAAVGRRGAAGAAARRVRGASCSTSGCRA